MTLIAIDFDGTITRHPGKFLILMMYLMSGGAMVIVLTAGAGELPPAERPAEIERRLKNLKIHKGAHYHEIVCVEGNKKGAWCSDNGVGIVIDDESGYLSEIGATSPQTVRFQCLP